MSDDSSVQKWTCEYCTFANFPSALKCTMCRGAKPLLNENIFRLRDESQPPASSGCSAYEWPSADDECRSADLLHEDLKPLRIVDASSTPTPPTDVNESSASSTALRVDKWSCTVCTYENWPKATRCVMCASPPPFRLSPTLSAEGATKDSNRHTSNNSEPNNFTASLRRSASRRIDDCSGGGRSSPAAAAEWRGRMLRAQADWAWLDACLGVVEGDFSPVDAYLSSGGDPTRQLTAKEVQLLE
ncbi:hypothetical protein LSTR_LSTR013041 [Laodelphax striatellus]|uniref:RanBP2-type domain-containing protein n=1 Tax=Laodelphax striatellus TaxID=195883 RepID=A0A482XCW1_LAOST|nr:hypothetical protein LSTR_LSTR013041 [Laodelphax striatellus]